MAYGCGCCESSLSPPLWYMALYLDFLLKCKMHKTAIVTRIARPMNAPIAAPILTASDTSFLDSMLSMKFFVEPGISGGMVRSGRAMTDWSDAVIDGAKTAVTETLEVGSGRLDLLKVSSKFSPHSSSSSSLLQQKATSSSLYAQ